MLNWHIADCQIHFEINSILYVSDKCMKIMTNSIFKSPEPFPFSKKSINFMPHRLAVPEIMLLCITASVNKVRSETLTDVCHAIPKQNVSHHFQFILSQKRHGSIEMI